MTLTIDHVIVYVENLQAAMTHYEDAGFTVNYGGQHADGNTENGLIIFADGAYIELIALVAGKTCQDAAFKPLLKAQGEGYTGYALQSDDIESDLATMREKGVIVGDILEGSRARPDGTLLQWKMAAIDNGMSPFVIQDLTARELRVPLTTEYTTHANGATGIHELLIRVPNLVEAIDRYGNIVGTPLLLYGAARFEVGTSSIVVTGGNNANSLPALLSLYTEKTDATSVELTGAQFLFI